MCLIDRKEVNIPEGTGWVVMKLRPTEPDYLDSLYGANVCGESAYKVGISYTAHTNFNWRREYLLYVPGFHIFVNESDAVSYTKHIDYASEILAIAEVKYCEGYLTGKASKTFSPESVVVAKYRTIINYKPLLEYKKRSQ